MSTPDDDPNQRTGLRGATVKALLLAACSLTSLAPAPARAAQTCPAPTALPPLGTCHPSACTPGFCTRGDIAPLSSQAATQPLQDRLVALDCSPHSIAPLQVFAEADPVTAKSRLFMYYLLDNTGFEPSVFTTRITGVNDDPSTMLTVWGANCGLATIGSVRLALEPKPGLPTDPDDPRAFTAVYPAIGGLFVTNKGGGWYEGWMTHALRVAEVAPPDAQAPPPFGKITAEDAARLAAMGNGNNVPGKFFTV